MPEGANNGRAAWQCPSNIALVKYWGKKGIQIPINPSISMTLDSCRTITEINYEILDKPGISFEFLFEGNKSTGFDGKISTLLARAEDILKLPDGLHMSISSGNTFPHSAGIASSASSMGALALCLLDISRKFNKTDKEMFFQTASHIARLGSGSASRSLYGAYNLWGRISGIDNSSEEYAVRLSSINDIFRDMKDMVMLVDSAPKSVSSTAGHAMMNGHPFTESRIAQAMENSLDLIKALSSGDMDEFIRISEQEALSLHALMMSSKESFMLLKPSTIKILEIIKRYRLETKYPVCFTLDAGPNVHLLYPGSIEQAVETELLPELIEHCEEGRMIKDTVGDGPERLYEN